MCATYIKNGFTSLEKEVQSLYLQMSGEDEPIYIGFAPLLHYAAADVENKTIYIHPLLLITPSNLPDRLYVQGPSDRKLEEANYFPDLASWLSKQFSLEKVHFDSLQNLFKQHLRFWNTPRKLTQIRHFALAHEVAHIHLKHKKNSWETKVAATSFLVVGAVAVATFKSLLFSCFAAVTISYVALRVATAFRKRLQQQPYEKEADLAAIKVTKDIEGAKAFFLALDDASRSAWRKRPLLEKVYQILTAPEDLFDLSHPAPKTRLQYIQEEFCKA